MDIRDLSRESPFNFGNLDKAEGLVIHHTGGRGTPQGVMETFRQRGLATQYIMDRDGTVHRSLPDGSRGQHIRPSQINNLTNRNTVGIEVIANDDRDLTEAQRAALPAFSTYATSKYGIPAANVFGHGEINSHKQSTEGASAIADWRAYNKIAAPPVSETPAASAPLAMAQRTLRGYAGGDAPSPLESAFTNASAATGVPVAVLKAIARQESGLNPNAVGKNGEIGLIQVKPSTAQNPGFGLAGVDPATLRDPSANAMFGAQYLAARAKAAGVTDFSDRQQLAKALMAYNGGGDPNYVANVTRYLPGGIPLNQQVQDAAARGGNMPSQRLRVPVNKAPPQANEIPVTSGSPAMDGTPSMPMAAAQQPMSPEAFQTAVYNGGALTGNEALDGRLKDDAVQRGYASWDEALKANQPAKTQEQDALAKLLSGQWG